MRCSSRPSRANKTGGGRRLVRALAMAFAARRCGRVVGAGPVAQPNPNSNPDVRHLRPTSQSDTDGDQFQFLGRLGRHQSRQQFSGAARQSGDLRLRQGAGEAIRAAAARPKHGGAAVPQLGRSLRTFGDDRSAWLFRRRSPPHLWRRRRGWCAHRARRQCRPFRRPKPHRDRHSAGAAIGNARSHPVRVQCLGRQGTVDLGRRAGSRLRKDQFKPRHRVRLCDRRLQRPRSTAR